MVFSTKYRYDVLKGDVQIRCRDIIRQVSEIMRRLKGRTSKKLQEEFPELHKRYWGRHFWSIGYGACSTGNLTEEMVEEYLNHHGKDPNGSDKFILE